MDVNKIMETVTTIGIAFGLKAVGAIVIWVVGRYLIHLAVRLVSASLEDSASIRRSCATWARSYR